MGECTDHVDEVGSGGGSARYVVPGGPVGETLVTNAPRRITPTLAAFLTSQLDADEAAARERDPMYAAGGPSLARGGPGLAWSYDTDSGYHFEIDPARVLADVAAKRAIVGRCVLVIAAFDDRENGTWPDVSRREKSHAWETLHDIAQPYRGADGWRDEWSA
jgi:hypothetical protein